MEISLLQCTTLKPVGTLKSLIEIFGPVGHAWPFVILAYRIFRDVTRK